ncbi:MAG TPA: cyclic nucleotide-binding domain-containing protein [Myxococcales bacterium]
MSDDGALSERDFEELCATGVRGPLDPGERLFALGEPARSMYFVRSGEVELVFPDAKGAKVVQPRGFFGELAFLAGGRRRTATAIARTACEVVEADEDAVGRLLSSNPSLLFGLLRRSCSYLLDSECNCSSPTSSAATRNCAAPSTTWSAPRPSPRPSAAPS